MCMRSFFRSARVLSLACCLAVAACDFHDEPAVFDGGEQPECSIRLDRLVSGGVPKDGIPALTNPQLGTADEAGWGDAVRVIGLVVDGQPVAVPHDVLWRHEIANFDFAGLKLAVTYCPLTGSSMAFDRKNAGGSAFGVSGLLYQSNLTMYNRSNPESLWPQMNRAAGCGADNGVQLSMYPVLEVTWAGWRALQPDTRVVTRNTGYNVSYASYPYGDYERIDNPRLLQPLPIDERRPPKERVLGIPDGDGGLALPFGELDALGPLAAVHEEVGGRPVVVFWDRGKGGAAAYYAERDGNPVRFAVDSDAIVDTESGSTWRLDGRAAAGAHAGAQLEAVPDAYVAFWFAWALFQPETRLYLHDTAE